MRSKILFVKKLMGRLDDANKFFFQHMAHYRLEFMIAAIVYFVERSFLNVNVENVPTFSNCYKIKFVWQVDETYKLLQN